MMLQTNLLLLSLMTVAAAPMSIPLSDQAHGPECIHAQPPSPWEPLNKSAQNRYPANTSSIAVEATRFEPGAIFTDGEDTMRAEIRLSGNVSRAWMVDRFGRLSVDGEQLDRDDEIELFDAGNGLWVRDDLRSQSEHQGVGTVHVRIEDASGNIEHFNQYATQFYVVHPKLAVEIEAVGTAAQRSSHVVNISDIDSEIMQIEPSLLDSNFDVRAASRAFNAQFSDDYDFLTFATTIPIYNSYFHVGVQNNIQGLGMGQYDNSETFGSSGRLRGVNYVGSAGGGPLLHESTHAYAMFLDPELGLSNGSPHWGAVNIPGFVFGIDFEEQGDDNYLITWTRFGGLDYQAQSLNRRFQPMEAYLWGLAGPEEVPDMTVLDGIDLGAIRAGDVVEAEHTRTVTIDDVIGVQGPRLPNFAGSQKRFRMAGVLVTDGRLATAAEMAAWNRIFAHFGSAEHSTMLNFSSSIPSFWFAANGRGEMATSIDEPLSDARLRRRVSGTYFNPERDGEGCQLTLEADDARMILTCYTYVDGDQVWMIGTGEMVGEDLVVADTVITRGAEYGDQFDPVDVERIPWGSVHMEFDDCNNARVEFQPDIVGFETFTSDMTRIIPGACDRAIPSIEQTELIGSFYDPARDGEGFHISLGANNETFVVTFYTYDNGEPMWLIGSGVIEDGSLVIEDFIRTRGTGFGTEFDPDAIQRSNFGRVEITSTDCNDISIALETDVTGFSDLFIEATRLVPRVCRFGR